MHPCASKYEPDPGFLLFFSKWAHWWAFFFTHSMNGWIMPTMRKKWCSRQLQTWMVNWCLRPLRKLMINRIIEPRRWCINNRILKPLRGWKLDRVLEQVAVNIACGNVLDCCQFPTKNELMCQEIWTGSILKYEKAVYDKKQFKLWLYEENSKDGYCTCLASYQILSIFYKKRDHASVNTNLIQVSYFFSQNGLFGGLLDMVGGLWHVGVQISLYEENSKDRYSTWLASYQILSISVKKCARAPVSTNMIQVSYCFSQSGLFSLCIVWMDDLFRRWGKPGARDSCRDGW